MKNGEGYRDPTASKAIRKAFKSRTQELMQIDSMRRSGQKECDAYHDGCFKVVNGKKTICPLKEDTRLCYAITSSNEEVKEAYRRISGKNV